MARRLPGIVGLLGVTSALALLTASPAAAAPTQPQTVTFTSAAPEGEDWFGGYSFFSGYYPASASASSGLPVTYSIDPTSADVCHIVGNSSSPPGVYIRYLGPGTCTIHADQAGNDEYLPAAQATQSFVIDKVQPTLAVLRQTNWPSRKRTFRATLEVPTQWDSRSWGLYGYSGQAVTFSVAGQRVCSGTTNDSGVATCAATLSARDWLRYTFVASYAGNARYKPVSRNGPTSGDRNPVFPEF